MSEETVDTWITAIVAITGILGASPPTNFAEVNRRDENKSPPCVQSSCRGAEPD